MSHGRSGAPVSVERLQELLEGIGSLYMDDETPALWPVDGLIHPGITCVMGQPLRGKTTLLISLCAALLSESDWLGKPTRFDGASRILYLCEDKSSAACVRSGLPDTDRVIVATLQSWGSEVSLTRSTDEANVGLVIIDSVYQAVGDVNDQARASLFLSVIQPVAVPVVVVHHEAKDGGSATPAGANRFNAAYRHTIRTLRCTPLADGSMRLHLDVFGNAVAGNSRFDVIVNRESLETHLESDDEPGGGQGAPRRGRKQRMSEPNKARVLGRVARKDGLPAGDRAGAYASALVGPDRKEDPNKQILVREVLGGGRVGVGYKSIAELIRNHRQEFDEGFGEHVDE